jgi:hypothetical protein
MTTMTSKSAKPIRQEREHRVAVLMFDHPSMFETSVAIEVWGNDRTAEGVPYSEVRLCSNDGPHRPSTHFVLRTTAGLG